MCRNGKFYTAGFRNPSQPDDVARCILDAITAGDYRLRWTVGKDAAGFDAGRPRISDEAWIAMGADLSDDGYNRRMTAYFAIELP